MGLELLSAKRTVIMMVFAGLQLLEGILYIVGLTGWSKKEDDVMNCYWAYSTSAADNDEVVLYGLRNLITADLSNDDSSFDQDYDDCADDFDYCKNCEEAGKTALGMSLLGFFFCGGVLIFCGVRAMQKMDSKNLKVAAIVITSFQLLWNIVAVGNFKNNCVDMLPLSTGSTQEIRMGPGYNCIAANAVFSALTLVIHILMPASSVSDDDLSEPLQDDNGGGSSTEKSPQENQV
mmetsp:Transcript_100828/g.217667  ORF Transcript_100828/g.217667 Transcript_100828/m.217667 type:complete len:234 (+) Transcript_100828:62-763(+)